MVAIMMQGSSGLGLSLQMKDFSTLKSVLNQTHVVNIVIALVQLLPRISEALVSGLQVPDRCEAASPGPHQPLVLEQSEVTDPAPG